MPMKNCLVAGVVSSGKTVFACRLVEQYGFSRIPGDALVLAFQEAFPGLGIEHEIAGMPDEQAYKSACQHFGRFLVQFVNALSWDSRLLYVLDTFHVRPADLAGLDMSKTTVLFFGYPDMDPETKGKQTKQYQTERYGAPYGWVAEDIVTVANTSGTRLNLRSGPGLAYSVTAGLPEGTRMSVIGGPVQADGYTWWNITGSAGTGWSCVGEWLTPSPHAGITVSVTYTGGYGLRLRSCADLSCSVITTLPEGTQMNVFGGPIQADGYTWWAIQGYVGGTLYTGWSGVGNWLVPNPRY